MRFRLLALLLLIPALLTEAALLNGPLATRRSSTHAFMGLSRKKQVSEEQQVVTVSQQLPFARCSPQHLPPPVLRRMAS